MASAQAGAHPVAVEIERPRWNLLVCALIAAGAALRLIALGQQSYWVDEIRSVIIATGGPERKWVYAVLNFHGPFHLVLLKIWMLAFGSGETATRALSAVLGILGLPLFYRLAVSLIGHRGAVFALLLCAISPFHIWYSQETRNYALLLDLGLLAIPLYLREIARQTRGSFLAALGVSLLLCLSNLAGVFLLSFYGLSVLLARRRGAYPLWRGAFFGVLVILLLTPWIARAVNDMGQLHLGRPAEVPGEEVVVRGESPPGVLSIPFAFYNFSLGFTLGPSIPELRLHHWAVLTPWLPYLLPAVGLFGLAAALGLIALRRRPRALRVLLLWLIPPVLLMALLSALNLKAANARYAMLSWCPYVLLLGAGLASLRRLRTALLLLLPLVFVSAHALYNYYADPRYWRADGRAVGRLLAAESLPSDAVVDWGVPEPLEFYAPQHLYVIRRAVQGEPPTAAEAERRLREATRHKQRVWYVRIENWRGAAQNRMLRACQEHLVPDGEWSFEKAEVRRFVVPPGWTDAAPGAGDGAPARGES